MEGNRNTITHAAFPLLVGYKLVHRASKAAYLMVRAMPGHPGTQQCETRYWEGRRCTETWKVKIRVRPGKVGTPSTIKRAGLSQDNAGTVRGPASRSPRT